MFIFFWGGSSTSKYLYCNKTSSFTSRLWGGAVDWGACIPESQKEDAFQLCGGMKSEEVSFTTIKPIRGQPTLLKEGEKTNPRPCLHFSHPLVVSARYRTLKIIEENLGILLLPALATVTWARKGTAKRLKQKQNQGMYTYFLFKKEIHPLP